MSDERRMGLVRHGHWLAYGLEHGVGMWLPYAVQRRIVHTWNVISCATFGHGPLFQDEEGGAIVCCNCIRSVNDPGEGVIRTWQFDFPRSPESDEAR